MTTHISIYKGYAGGVEVRSTAPTDREMTEYEGGNLPGLADGDWYFDSNSHSLAIRIGGTWNFIGFQI